jgi:hypothetical protein
MAAGCRAPTSPSHNRFGRTSRGLVLIAAVIAIEVIPTGTGTIAPGSDQLFRQALAPKAHLHIARANSEESIGSPQTRTIAGEGELGVSQEPAPSTRGSFMATWMPSRGAAGYQLDVSTSPAFDSYVPGWRDADIGNAAGRVVTGLNPGTTYFYRVRAYASSGTSASSAVMGATTSTTQGLIIRAIFDGSITSSANAVAIEATINRAIAICESLFRDPITINVLFRYSANRPDGTPLVGIAESKSAIYQEPWQTYINALLADVKSTNDVISRDYVPKYYPLSPNVAIASANGRAVGLNTPPAMLANGTFHTGGGYDGIVTLNSTKPFQFGRPIGAGVYDAQRAIEHEIDEVMGLGSYLGQGSDLRPQDLFTWQGWGYRGYDNRYADRYFSIDGGETSIAAFNKNPNGDYGDWASETCPKTGAPPYVQDAFACTGQAVDVTPTSPEGINLDVIGYDPASADLPRSRAIVVDFNADGFPDYLVYNRTTRRTALWYLNDYVLIGGAYGPTIPAGWSLVDAADFDGDGHSDYVLVNTNTGQTGIWYLSGPTLLRGSYGPTIPAGWRLVLAKDFNNDGKPDLLLYNPTTHQTALWYLDGGALVSGAYGPTLPAGWTLVGAGDFDGDGNPDYLLFAPGTGQTAIWYLAAATFVNSHYGPSVGNGTGDTNLVGTADFNRDGKPDYLVFAVQNTVVWHEDDYRNVNSHYGPTIPHGWTLTQP